MQKLQSDPQQTLQLHPLFNIAVAFTGHLTPPSAPVCPAPKSCAHLVMSARRPWHYTSCASNTDNRVSSTAQAGPSAPAPSHTSHHGWGCTHGLRPRGSAEVCAAPPAKSAMTGRRIPPGRWRGARRRGPSSQPARTPMPASTSRSSASRSAPSPGPSSRRPPQASPTGVGQGRPAWTGLGTTPAVGRNPSFLLHDDLRKRCTQRC